MVALLGVGAAGYGFHETVWIGLQEEEEILLSEKSNLESNLNAKNVSALEVTLKDLNERNQEAELRMEEVFSKRTFGAMDYQKLISFMGAEADALGVDLVTFKKIDIQDKKVYREIPYDVTVQGSYENIILFVNSLYKMEKYFYFTGMSLGEIERVPMTELVIEGSEELRQSIEFTWAGEFMDKLDESIPADLRKETKEALMNEFYRDLEKYESNIDLNLAEAEEVAYDKLQLRFVFKFIELDK